MILAGLLGRASSFVGLKQSYPTGHGLLFASLLHEDSTGEMLTRRLEDVLGNPGTQLERMGSGLIAPSSAQPGNGSLLGCPGQVSALPLGTTMECAHHQVLLWMGQLSEPCTTAWRSGLLLARAEGCGTSRKDAFPAASVAPVAGVFLS